MNFGVLIPNAWSFSYEFGLILAWINIYYSSLDYYLVVLEVRI